MMVGNDEAMVLSHLYSTPGIGNYLVFAPAVFWFAALTGRNVVIGDGIMAEFCSYVNCQLNGFKTKSELFYSGRYDNTSTLISVGRHQLIKHLEGQGDLMNARNVRGNTKVPATDFWLWIPFAARCVKRLSNCVAVGDVSCSERCAYQAPLYTDSTQTIPSQLCLSSSGLKSNSNSIRFCLGCPPNIAGE